MLASERRFDETTPQSVTEAAFHCATGMRIGTSNGVAPVTPAFMSSDKGLSKLSP
jgi:hypothetical protein